MKYALMGVIILTFAFNMARAQDKATPAKSKTSKSQKNQEFKKGTIGDAERRATMAMVFFEEPLDGANVESKFEVKMAVMGYDVKPAGTKTANTGHHHIIVDGEPVPAGQAIPVSPKHIHYGKGETEAKLELPSGKHTLTLQFADGNHVSYGEEMSQTITVHVK